MLARLPFSLRADGVHQAHHVAELHGQAYRLPRADAAPHRPGGGAHARHQLSQGEFLYTDWRRFTVRDGIVALFDQDVPE